MTDLDILKELRESIENRTYSKIGGFEAPDPTYYLIYYADKNNNIIELDISEHDFGIPPQVSQLKNVTRLILSQNEISDLSPLKGLKQIIKLDLSSNYIKNIFILKELVKVTELNLSSNKIKDISSLKDLKQITKLDLSSNLISDLTPIRHLFEKPEFEFKLDSNPLQIPPLEIVMNGKEAIRAWFAEQEKTKMVPNTYVKLIVIGNTTVGKTSLINFITKQTFSENEYTTHGISQTNWKVDLNSLKKRNFIETLLNKFKISNEVLDVSIWDFGGQEYYHSTHQLFFSNQTLYLLMYDKLHNCSGWLETDIYYSDKGKVKEELEYFNYFYWLRNIRRLSNQSKILMLQNKVDNPSDEFYPNNVCFEADNDYKVDKPFKSISILNIYKKYKENNRLPEDFIQLREILIGKLKEVKKGEILKYYLKSKELIEIAATEQPIVSIKEFIKICIPANPNIDKIITNAEGKETEYAAWELMCVYFHETGVLLYYPDSPSLKNKIFIRPKFVTDSIYKVLNYEIKQKSGHFTFADAVKALDNNRVLATDIIELMTESNFKLIFNYPEGSENYIAPQYLNKKKPSIHHAVKKMEIGFVFEFAQFLPKFILIEFMVNYGRFQVDDTIWKDGIIFEKYGTTALVECLFKERQIIFKSDKSGEFNRLKYEVFDTFRSINRVDKLLNISIDNEHFYSLETILTDYCHEAFSLFRDGYKKYKQYVFSLSKERKKKSNIDLLDKMEEMRLETKQDMIYITFLLEELGDNYGFIRKEILSLSEQGKQLVFKLVQSVNSEEIEKNKEETKKANELLEYIVLKLNELSHVHKTEVEEKLKHEISMGAKLKFTIPLIPGMLNYERELVSWSAKKPITWKSILSIIRKGRL